MIENITVIGSGVMGCGIAAHFANAGFAVSLLDIVPKDAEDRSILAKSAVEKALKTEPAAFSHPKNAKRIYCGNLEDDEAKIAASDWIIEVIVERLDIKQNLYRKLDAIRKKGSVVSSNTSTLPLAHLVDGMPQSFRADFMITHFFNPPRYMHLLELVAMGDTRKDAIEEISHICDVRLGKGIVICKDTPGFIANRIGCYWLMAGLQDAIATGISVEEADQIMGKPFGIPKTGVFGLFDLIGIDLMPLIAKSMLEHLPANDAFRKESNTPELVAKMISEGYTGRKGKGGFYRINKQGEKKIKEVINLGTGEYAKEQKPDLASAKEAKKGLFAAIDLGDIGSIYAKKVMAKTLAYAASLVPEISDDIASVDDAMRWGYNWKFGPFQLIDKLGHGDKTGAAVLAEILQEMGIEVPAILKLGKKFYDKNQYLGLDGNYVQIVRPKGQAYLVDYKGNKPAFKNPSSALWDIGDGIYCFEFASKMNSLDPELLEGLRKSCEFVKANGRGLVIANDTDRFSVGANLSFFLYAVNIAAFDMMEQMIKEGQDTYMGLKYAPFPVVAALTGMALGGGCEMILHCDHIQAHLESYPGLVEVAVGVIPGWGGCKEMVFRSIKPDDKQQMPQISKIFEMISTAKVAKSAEDAMELGIIKRGGITMNRDRLLIDAKNAAMELAKDYQSPKMEAIHLTGKAGVAALEMAVQGFVDAGKASEHDAYIARCLAKVLCGDEVDMLDEVSEQDLLDLERKYFMELIRHPKTIARIEHMLETNKPLRN